MEETMCWEVYLIWQKKIIENRDKSEITKHLIFPICFCQREIIFIFLQRTSDGGNGNHSVSLPIILIEIKVDQMLPSSYISSLLVSILWFCISFPISMNVRLYFGAKMVSFCIIHIGNRKIFLKHHSPRVPTNPFARKCVPILYMIYVKS